MLRTVRNVVTGAVYDLVEYERIVTNRRDDSVTTVKLIRKMRRPGTGTAGPITEVVIDDDEVSV